jgi:general secretion pathway protein F
MVAAALAARFELVVRTRLGVVQTLALRARDAADARALASRDGLQVLACVPQRAQMGRPRLASGRSRGPDVASFAFELSSLLSAGLSLLEALRTLATKERVPVRQAMLNDLIEHVSRGLPLSGALDVQPGRYPRLLVATVSASEQTGDLAVSLRRYAEHQQSLRRLRDQVVGAAIYPALLLLVGSGVILFLLGVVVPKFALLIESTRHELPWSSALLMGWGRFVAAHAWPLAAAALAALALLIVGARRARATGGRGRWLEALPMVGPTVRTFRHAQLYRTAGMLVRGGIPAPRAFELSSNLLGETDERRLTAALRMIREGRGLSDALQTAGLADPVATSMLAVAERTGALAEMLERLALFHETTVQRLVEVISRLFEPALMIVIGLVIGAIVVLMYLPIFDLASSLQ